MTFFDFMEDLNFITKSGKFYGAMEEMHEGIALGNKFRQALFLEDDEQYEDLQKPEIRNEFIFNLFTFLQLGGQMCQYEDDVGPVLDVTKNLYKDLVTVAKDPDSGEIKPISQVFKVEIIRDTSGNNQFIYSEEDHP
eukprot:CAMPEP_0176361816 /NCGR_PEP_ID=MMETSP0126-20121128/18009_1 /TAXON_ID=141414 ORGANISM="Strombidinopsis acuminatum, Strain SPMC142" /NCGR_SAMPLE_ID=MMETSP0126 /ASSEMBLY_ACC=CAM_ASM_000229 /LENGTH=136 /DNA_ID=CAMNT_0017717517 /DNA_START=354 /DNA_END=764 /DNA_ORIENTATION=-